MKAILMAAPLLAAGAVLAVSTLAAGDGDAATRARLGGQRPSVARPAKLSISASQLVSEPGCNATAFAQLPGDRSLFIGRQLITDQGRIAGVSGPNDCSGGDAANQQRGRPFNRWALVLDRMDWKTKRFSIVKPLLDPTTDPKSGRSRALVTGGPMRGLRIMSAYDPSVAQWKGTTYVAFECTVENGVAFGVQQTSSCISVYDPRTKSLDMKRTVVAVSGDRQGNVYHAAAVPRLLAFGGRLYLYWSALEAPNGAFGRTSVRGAELVPTGGTVMVKGARGKAITPMASLSTQTWGPVRGEMSDLAVNLMGFQNDGRSFIAFAALGGSGCAAPSGQSRGCFRLVAKRSSTPLAPDAWTKAAPVDLGLPTNPQEYAAPVTDPSGKRWILGHFIRPPRNGFSERGPAPSAAFWQSNKRASALALIPME